MLIYEKPVNNHLWWSSKTCYEDRLLFIEKFTSVLHYISEVHEWNESYYALKKIIMAKKFLKDLQQAKNFVHTGRLESYHNIRLKYMPKRIHLKYDGMHMRSIIAI